MEELWIMLRIFLIVLAWGGVLLLLGFGLEMLTRALGRSSAHTPVAVQQSATPTAKNPPPPSAGPRPGAA